MKYSLVSRSLALGLLMVLSAFLSSCQENGPKPGTSQSSSTEKAAAPAANVEQPVMSPAANQSAPVPQGQALEILRFGPSGNIKQLSQVIVMFNQPMVALGNYSSVPEGVLTIDPPIEGQTRWLNQYTLAFVPAEPLTGSLDLKASFNPSDLKALSGAALSEGAEIEIKLPELAVNHFYQSNEAYDEEQALKPVWRVFFNQPPSKDSLIEKARFVYQFQNGAEQRVASEVENCSAAIDCFTFKPQEKLPRNTPYRLILEEGVKSAAGPKPAPELKLAEGSTYGPLKITRDQDNGPVSPEYGLYLTFSNPVDFSEIVKLLSIDNGYDLTALKEYFAEEELPAENQGEEEFESLNHIGTYLYIDGNFKADNEYTLTIDGSARDVFGQTLGKNYVYKFKTGPYPTRLDLGDSYGLLETATDPRFKLVASNIKEAKIQAYALSADEAIGFLSAAGFNPDYFYQGNLAEAEKKLAALKPLTSTIEVPNGAQNGRTRVPLNLKDIFGDKLQGHLLYLKSSWRDSRSTDKKLRSTFALLQVTDIGLALKVGPSSSLIWTTDLSAGRSWAGVEIELRGSGGELLWQGLSDENGLARLPGTVEMMSQMETADDRRPGIFVVAKSGNQMSLWNAGWDSGLESWRWNINYADAMGDGTDDRHLLLSALPLYKPGEKAKFKIISRVNKSDSLKDFSEKKLYVEISDGMGQVVNKASLEVSPFGTSSHELDIATDASLGQWTVRAGQDEGHLSYAGSFMVMTYRPPAFEVKFENLPPNALVDSEVTIKAKADYHFGSPVSGQPAYYHVVSSPAWFSLPGGFSTYSVTNSYYPADEEEDSGYGYTEPSVTVTSGESRLDSEGRLAFPLSLKANPEQKPAPRNYTVYMNVTDVDQRSVGANSQFLVHPAEIYAGLRIESYVGESGQAFPIKVIAANRDGRLLPGRPVKATVYRRVWQNVRRKSAGTAYEYVSRMVDEKISEHDLVSREMPLELEIAPEKPGFYIVQAETKDDGGRINLASSNFYISGRGPVGWKMSNDDKLTLIADKSGYKPGETSRIMIQSPFDQGQGLLTVERSGIRSSKVFAIDSQTPIVEVPLTEEDSPNVFVSVLLSRGRISETLDESGVDFGKPAIKAGYTELKVPSQKNLLTVAVKADPAEVGPGEEVEIEVAVSDSEGQALSKAEVALISADAAVIQLASDDGYFPQRVLHRDQPLRIQTADNLISLIGRQNWGLKGGNPGGGGALAAQAGSGGAGLRSNFAALAFFEPHLKLDAQGKAKIKIKMPENLSTFKIFAVATGHDLLSGTGQSSVLVSRDLLVRSALPGYAGVGDEFQAAMVVSNRGGKAGQAKVVLSGENFTLVNDTAEKTVSVKPGESREVSFRVKAGQGREAKFQFTVNMGRDSDGAQFTIPLSPANQLTTEASYEHITGGSRRTDLALPQGLDQERGGLELELSPSLVGVLSEPFDWLLAYPHGCVEQSISKAYGSLVRLSLKGRFPADTEREHKDRRNVDDMLKKLSLWERGGGFNTWPDNYDWNRRSVYLSVYALDFLLTAREAGFELPNPDLVKSISDFLKQSLSADYKNWPGWYSEVSIRKTKTYALAMLSRAGENVAAYIATAYAQRDEAGLNELINLLRAIQYSSASSDQIRQERFKDLLGRLEKHIQVTAGEIQLSDTGLSTPEIWSSPVLDTALALNFLCQTHPKHDLIAPMARWLVGESKAGHFGTTHSNAQAILALAEYVKVMEPENPDLSIKALLGEKTLAEARFTAFTDPAVTAAAPLSAIPKDDPAVIYNLEGQGQVWAALKLKSAPAEPDLSASTTGGFILSRSFSVLDSEGQGRPGSESFKRGDLVRVTVTMLVPAKRHGVVMEDRVPAGLEPVNFQLNDADMNLMPLVNTNEETESRGRSLYWYDHQEIWPDKVAVYADYLDSGVYTFSYLARAITPGTYLTPGPKAEEMYAPETFGRGEGQRLTIE